jgi:hypothetical protein
MAGRNMETLLSYHCLTGKHFNTYLCNCFFGAVYIYFFCFGLYITKISLSFIDRSSLEKPSFRVWQGNQQATTQIQNIHRRVWRRNCEYTFLFVQLSFSLNCIMFFAYNLLHFYIFCLLFNFWCALLYNDFWCALSVLLI